MFVGYQRSEQHHCSEIKVALSRNSLLLSRGAQTKPFWRKPRLTCTEIFTGAWSAPLPCVGSAASLRAGHWFLCVCYIIASWLFSSFLFTRRLMKMIACQRVAAEVWGSVTRWLSLHGTVCVHAPGPSIPVFEVLVHYPCSLCSMVGCLFVM